MSGNILISKLYSKNVQSVSTYFFTMNINTYLHRFLAGVMDKMEAYHIEDCRFKPDQIFFNFRVDWLIFLALSNEALNPLKVYDKMSIDSTQAQIISSIYSGRKVELESF